MPVSSVGEDRAILLGFAMMAFSVLMVFVVGITVVKPYVNRCTAVCLIYDGKVSLLFSSHWEEAASCVLLQADILEEWVDCRSVSTVPCLRVTVNLTDSNQRAFLHFDEESVLLAPEVGIYMALNSRFQVIYSFISPRVLKSARHRAWHVDSKCQMDRTELDEEALKVKDSLDTQLGSTLSCFADPARHPKDVILSRKYTFKNALFAMLWPGLMLGGGALLVGLVKLTQCVARLSSEMCSGAAAGRPASRYTRGGKLYRILGIPGAQSPS